jgi:hypothetical protein
MMPITTSNSTRVKAARRLWVGRKISVSTSLLSTLEGGSRIREGDVHHPVAAGSARPSQGSSLRQVNHTPGRAVTPRSRGQQSTSCRPSQPSRRPDVRSNHRRLPVSRQAVTWNNVDADHLLALPLGNINVAPRVCEGMMKFAQVGDKENWRKSRVDRNMGRNRSFSLGCLKQAFVVMARIPWRPVGM